VQAIDRAYPLLEREFFMVLVRKKYFNAIVFLCALLWCVGQGWAEKQESVEKPSLYAAYEKVLQQVVNDRGLVHYSQLATQSEVLDQFLEQIKHIPKAEYQKWPKEEQIAFWINAYNAMAMKIIAQHYPLQAKGLRTLFYPKNSIAQIPGVWQEITFVVLGTPLSLDAIEHSILRKQFKEPRIHMALVNASLGASRLKNEPYTGAQLQEQLNEQVRKFVRDQNKFGLDGKTKRIYLAVSLKWYGKDFVAKYQGTDRFKKYSRVHQAILTCLSRHLGDETIHHLEKVKYSIEYLDYDWTLNQAEQLK
jgi:Protein of unknown function, DUF547